MAEKTFTLASGQSITMRSPTEAEVLAYLDRRADVEMGIRPSMDAYDDGDKQLEACVTSPDREALADLFEDYPLLNRTLRAVFMELAGGEKTCRRDDSLILPEYRTSGARLIAFLYDGAPQPVRGDDEAEDVYTARVAAWEQAQKEAAIVLKKLTRFEIKALEYETRQAERTRPQPSALAKLAKAHVATLAGRPGHKEQVRDLLASAPLLAANLGVQLFNAATVALQEEQGK